MRATTYQIGTVTPVAVLGPGDVGAILQADSGNTADIYLGGDTVTADATGTGGYRLSAAQAITVDIVGSDILYAIAPTAGQIIRVVQGMRA
jgi:hypothetical protein